MPRAPKPNTIEDYLAALPADRRASLEVLRAVIDEHVGPEFESGIQYGMPAWYLPHSVYPHGYHCDPEQPVPFASIAAQKNHIGIYLFCVYCDPEEKARFVDEWKASGHRLDMGASCVRVKSADEVPLEVLGRYVRRATRERFVQAYESILPAAVRRKRAAAEAATGTGGEKATAKTGTPKKAATKKAAAKKGTAKNGTAKKAGGKKTTEKTPAKARTAGARNPAASRAPAAKKTGRKKTASGKKAAPGKKTASGKKAAARKKT